MNCERCAELLVARLEGELDANELAAVEAHLATCADCSAWAAHVAELHAALTHAGAEVLREVTGRVGGDRRGALLSPIPRRRFGAGLLATAATVIVAVLVISTPWSGRSSSAYAAVAENVRRARTVVLRFSAQGDGIDMNGSAATFEVYNGDRMRIVQPNGAVLIYDDNSRQGLALSPANRTATTFKMASADPPVVTEDGVTPAAPGAASPIADFDRLLRTLVDDDAEYVGERVVDGRECLEYRAALGPGEPAARVLVDPATLLPVRIEREQDGLLIVADVQFEVALDPNDFSLTPPPGYTLLPGTARDPATWAETMRRMRMMVMACFIVEQETGHWPASLAGLEQYGVTQELLQNPSCPDREIGYDYFPPTATPESPEPVIIECPPTAGAGRCVAFTDGHVEYVTDAERLERLLGKVRGK